MLGKLNELKNMTVEELKDEYFTTSKNDVVKKEMLKKLIKSKISEKKATLKNKIQTDNVEKNKKSTQLIQSTKSTKSTHSAKSYDSSEKRNLVNNHNQLNKSNESNELDQSDKYDRSDKNDMLKEIGIDFSNNKLMERLNCELDFRVYGDKSTQIIPPYSNVGGNLKEFENNINKFTNK